MHDQPKVSIIIPTYNGAGRISECLTALEREVAGKPAEIIVVNDGSTDGTSEVLRRFPAVRAVNQPNSGPAVARNRGVRAAQGDLILFTDDDCVPAPGWLDAMLAPFEDQDVVGAKGRYLTRQTGLVARFVQLDYEDRYRITARHPEIDFIDTYSAAFRRERFLELNGYDTSFPVACAEDAELSYRMSSKGWKMRFVPQAMVYHQHPDSLGRFLHKKVKFAYWRILAVTKNPSKAVRDSHTPQVMKLQLLFLPALLAAVLLDLLHAGPFWFTAVVLLLFAASALPFTVRAIRKDPVAGIWSPAFLALRSCAQLLGVAGGLANTKLRRQPGLVPAHGSELAGKETLPR